VEVEVLVGVVVTVDVDVEVTTGMLVVVVLVVRVPAVTAVCACCPLPSTVMIYFSPATTPCVGASPCNMAKPPRVTCPLKVKVAPVPGASA